MGKEIIMRRIDTHPVKDENDYWIVFYYHGDLAHPIMMMWELEFEKKMKEIGYVKLPQSDAPPLASSDSESLTPKAVIQNLVGEIRYRLPDDDTEINGFLILILRELEEREPDEQ